MKSSIHVVSLHAGMFVNKSSLNPIQKYIGNESKIHMERKDLNIFLAVQWVQIQTRRKRIQVVVCDLDTWTQRWLKIRSIQIALVAARQSNAMISLPDLQRCCAIQGSAHTSPSAGN